jgi:predicted Zn-ribbon and HTH transcriptional regulator
VRSNGPIYGRPRTGLEYSGEGELLDKIRKHFRELDATLPPEKEAEPLDVSDLDLESLADEGRNDDGDRVANELRAQIKADTEAARRRVPKKLDPISACRICGMRREDMPTHPCNGRCPRCSKYWARNGKERPENVVQMNKPRAR